MQKKIKNEEIGYMNTHSSNSFQLIYNEFIETILKKYCGPEKDICSLGCYNDDLIEQIKYKRLTLVDNNFGPCKYPDPFYVANIDPIPVNQFEGLTNHIKDNVCMAHRVEMNIDAFLGHVTNLYDVIIMSTVIEHMTNRYACEEVLTKIKARLKPGGVFIMTYPNARSINRLVGVELGMLSSACNLSPKDVEVGHKYMYIFDDIAQFSQYLDMEMVFSIGIMFKPLSHGQMSTYFTTEELKKFIKIGYELGPKTCSYVGGVFQNED